MKQAALLLNLIETVCPKAEINWHEPLIDDREEYEVLKHLGFIVKGRYELEQDVFNSDGLLGSGTNLYFILGANYKLLESLLKSLSTDGCLHKSLFITGVFETDKSSKYVHYFFKNSSQITVPAFGEILADEFLIQFSNPMEVSYYYF
uniref:Uncharacterized protein n=1 Tax=Ditylenchus dipsaci TaxID=166011 RepID=A0A915CKT0_9BILA